MPAKLAAPNVVSNITIGHARARARTAGTATEASRGTARDATDDVGAIGAVGETLTARFDCGIAGPTSAPREQRGVRRNGRHDAAPQQQTTTSRDGPM